MRLVIFCHLVVLVFSLTSLAQEAEFEASLDGRETKSRFGSNTKKKMALKRKLVARGYEVAEIPEYKIPPALSREDLNKILPNDVTAQSESEEVLKKIGDKALQTWLKSSTMQSLSVIQTAQKVEQALKTEVALGEVDEEGKPQHKINFQVQAIQAISKIDYKGLVDCTVSYNMRDQKTGFEVREKVFKDKDLFVSHSAARSENLSSVGVRWSF